MTKVHINQYEELVSLVKNMFYYLDMVEESEEGRKFHPTNISSCRVMDGEALNKILARMKDVANDKYPR